MLLMLLILLMLLTAAYRAQPTHTSTLNNPPPTPPPPPHESAPPRGEGRGRRGGSCAAPSQGVETQFDPHADIHDFIGSVDVALKDLLGAEGFALEKTYLLRDDKRRRVCTVRLIVRLICMCACMYT